MTEHDPHDRDTRCPASRRRATGPRRRGPARAAPRAARLGLPADPGGAGRSSAVGGYFGVTRGIDVDAATSSARRRGLPGPGLRVGDLRGRRRATRVGRDGPQPRGSRAWSRRVEAFTDAASANAAATGIQAGFFELKKEMKATDVVEILVDPRERSSAIRSPCRRGPARSTEIVDAARPRSTEFRQDELHAGARRPGRARAARRTPRATPRATCSPATYAFGPDATPTSILTAMVDPVRGRRPTTPTSRRPPSELGYTPHELMTVASLLQAEGRGDDMPKIARVIYNRLEIDGNPSSGFLQIDATVNYALGPQRSRGSRPPRSTRWPTRPTTPTATRACRRPDRGPGSTTALEAALTPADGPWFFYVTVNLKTGRDQVHRRPRRVPAVQGASSTSTARPSPTAAERPA